MRITVRALYCGRVMYFYADNKDDAAWLVDMLKRLGAIEVEVLA